MNDYFTPFTRKNLLLNLVLTSVIIGGAILFERWDTRRYEKLEKEVRARTDEQIDKTRKLFDDFKN